jgi:LPPG:FO 2-phospho-L-lactate transferase
MKITALAGGVGASKFLLGLTRVMPPEDVTIIANTGDDIEMFGLRICPDIDTVTYTLAGVIDDRAGWGLRNDTFECLQNLASFGEDTWFNLGDKDLATHLFRTNQLRQGRSVSEITLEISRQFGVGSTILPMTDAYTPTRVITDEGEMHFQEYFVRRMCEPRVLGLRFDGIEAARPAPGVLEAILDADGIIVCPSNPFISIGPILEVPGVREALVESRAKIVAITPIVGGKALKGPAADMLRDFGYEVSAGSVAGMYRDFLDIFIIDQSDSGLEREILELGIETRIADTIMSSLDKKEALASFVLSTLSSN